MFCKLVILLPLLISVVGSQDTNFIYNGFRSVNLSLDGNATITSNGLLELTDDNEQQMGHAFYPTPISFKNSLNDSAFSFSTTFVFAIASGYPALKGQGIAFVISPTRGRPGALPNQYLGLFNETNNGNATNHVVAVELDTIRNQEFKDINDNHVGVDINGMVSENSSLAGYYADSGAFMNLTLISGNPMQVWVEYDGVKKQLNVTLAPIDVGKPKFPLLSLSRDLSPIINKTMYVGFSSTNGPFLTFHYILGWSFKMNGKAQELALSQLPKLPRGATYVIKRKRKFAELVEDWEVDYGPHRFKYKDLYIATKGFRDKELLGSGGFGKVYKGVLTTSKIEIAVKKVSHESRQGMREFVAEIVSIGRLRHRNLVPLLGYCRRKGELLLVYDYLSNGSLDKYLFDQPQVTLSWSQRFKVIKGVASGLFYLHEGWDQVVIHRDVKASNVLLDGELNGKLGDFGLARLYDHGTDPQTTHVVGTLGYLAPEHTRSGKATTSTDVFAFGAFMLEVACGRRPIQANGPSEDSILVEWVFFHLSQGEIMEARDPSYGTSYVAEELELVLKLGLMCSHSEATARPSMRQVVQYLEGDVPFPDLSSLGLCSTGLTFAHREGFDDFFKTYPSSMNEEFSHSSSIVDSLLSGGR
nr:l-type lectin-domain containing receptor kinase iv.2 [Quercus suber]